MQVLNKIQSEMNAPKNQFNTFGKYSYRNCEDILQAVKPYLNDSGATLLISDEIVLIGDRYYVKATATIRLDKEYETATAYAREAAVKKGMDDSQITGAASSYARKYALNGLFCIDDNKDADSKEKVSIPDQITSCQSIPQLQDLWGKLDKKEQDANKDLFGQAKTNLLPEATI
jgi:hypothetical protein